MIQAIFFDFNGVIIDDERLHLRAYREVLQGHSVELTDDDYFKCLGMDDVAFTRAAFERVGRAVDDETTRTIIDREHELHRSIIESEVPFAPGVITFVKEAAMRALAVTNTVSETLLREAGADVVSASLADWNTDAVRRVFA